MIGIPLVAKNLISKMLKINPKKRPKIEKILKDPFL